MSYHLNIRGSLLSLEQPKVMGIINLTDDSFYSGSRISSEQLLDKVKAMLNDGADILDLGAYSSRPGAKDIPINLEAERIEMAVKAIRSEYPDSILSIDTFRSQIAERGLDAGADIVNDISAGLLDKQMLDLIAERQVPYIAMHMRGTPQTMQTKTTYSNLILDVVREISERTLEMRNKGINDIIIDPGFGFSKTIDQNYELLMKLDAFRALDLPILVGISRKSMIYKTLETTPESALNGTSFLHNTVLEKGANILRVHDVKEAKECVSLWSKLKEFSE